MTNLTLYSAWNGLHFHHIDCNRQKEQALGTNLRYISHRVDLLQALFLGIIVQKICIFWYRRIDHASHDKREALRRWIALYYIPEVRHEKYNFRDQFILQFASLCILVVKKWRSTKTFTAIFVLQSDKKYIYLLNHLTNLQFFYHFLLGELIYWIIYFQNKYRLHLS